MASHSPPLSDAIDCCHSTPQEHGCEQQRECEYEYEYEYIDVVWLKRDVRWTDHGPLSEVATGGSRGFGRQPKNGQQKQALPAPRVPRKFVLLYLHEPDQLRVPSVHGSHLRFVHEGLVDMEERLKEYQKQTPGETGHHQESGAAAKAASPEGSAHSDREQSGSRSHSIISPSFEYLTVCHNTIISTLASIHFRYLASSVTISPQQTRQEIPPPPRDGTTGTGSETKPAVPVVRRTYYKIARLLAHEETGHWESYQRDERVRKWCATRGIPFVEFGQTGVTRGLRDRDDYLSRWKAFMAKPPYPSGPDLASSESFRERLLLLDKLPGFLSSPNGIAGLFDDDHDAATNNNPAGSAAAILGELPAAHRSDRPRREQCGGETRALGTLRSFLSSRGANYAAGISSPNSSWNSCSRLSPYLTWGHISLRWVLRSLEETRDRLRKEQQRQRKQKLSGNNPWLRSLQAFASRAHWRSHFIQKLESEPMLEKRDLCPAYQHLRRGEGDWDQAKYDAWENGTTGHPFVDACMRCLVEHGWINFRMRAMLVSFATYNLWLDWKRIAPHLARVFLDYEPGIHYPQLQMQAGTTGINAMRVYNVTKQGKDQDPKGRFIRKYVSELRKVPDQYIHEPWKMSEALKQKYYHNQTMLFSSVRSKDNDSGDVRYPEPIVDEKESARIAKEKLNTVKKELSTRIQANQVFLKHGSRSRQSNEWNGRTRGSAALPAAIEALGKQCQTKTSSGGRQPNIRDAFSAAAVTAATSKKIEPSDCGPPMNKEVVDLMAGIDRGPPKRRKPLPTPTMTNKRIKAAPVPMPGTNGAMSAIDSKRGSWSCTACTFLNEKPHGLVCTICGTPR